MTPQLIVIGMLALYLVQAIGTTIRWVREDPRSTIVNLIASVSIFAQLITLTLCLVFGGFFK